MDKNEKIDIYNIAKEANVSPATVSRVLNKKNLVSKQKTEIVLKVCEKYGYKPSRIARSMRTQKSNYLGFFVPEINNPFFLELLKGANNYANEYDYYLVTYSSDYSYEREQHFFNSIISRKIDGVMFSGIEGGKKDKELIENFLNHKIPCVLVDRYMESLKVPIISSDNFKGGSLAAEYLLNLGHKNIGYLTYNLNIKIFNDRFLGFKNQLNRKGLKELFIKDFSSFNSNIKTEMEDFKEILLNEKCTAIFCASDFIAAYLIDFLKKNHIKIPGEISIVGFDDVILSEMMDPKLTSVSQDVYTMGLLASKTLINIIENKPYKKKILLEPKLVIRDSVREIPAVRE